MLMVVWKPLKHLSDLILSNGIAQKCAHSKNFLEGVNMTYPCIKIIFGLLNKDISISLKAWIYKSLNNYENKVKFHSMLFFLIYSE